EKGRARESFVAHVRSRMRRVRRGHDRPYAIYEAFGGWRIPKDKYYCEAESEPILRDHIRQLVAARPSSCMAMYAVTMMAPGVTACRARLSSCGSLRLAGEGCSRNVP